MARKKRGGGSGLKEGPSGSTRRYNQMVKRVSETDDIKKLKKMIYNRNYRIRKAYEKAHPEYAKHKGVVQFPPIEDLRVIAQSTLNRINDIKDPEKQIKELRKIIINTTRRRNKPKTTGDFSNREQDYLANGVASLKEALANWNDPKLEAKLKGAFDNISVVDMNNIFENVPSYWAISEGYYYAVTDFDNFMDEIYKLIERDGVTLTSKEKYELEGRMFSNDPRGYNP